MRASNFCLYDCGSYPLSKQWMIWPISLLNFAAPNAFKGFNPSFRAYSLILSQSDSALFNWLMRQLLSAFKNQSDSQGLQNYNFSFSFCFFALLFFYGFEGVQIFLALLPLSSSYPRRLSSAFYLLGYGRNSISKHQSRYSSSIWGEFLLGFLQLMLTLQFCSNSWLGKGCDEYLASKLARLTLLSPIMFAALWREARISYNNGDY